MVSRLCSRLLTGPLAFFVGGLLDVGTLAVTALGERARRRGADAPPPPVSLPRAPGS